MGIIFNFGNDVEKMQPGGRTTFDDLDFIADRFEDLQLQELEPPVEEKEQPPPVCALFARSVENMTSTLRSEWENPYWVPRSNLPSLPDHILLGFSTGLRDAAATYSSWLQQALAEPAEPRTEENHTYDSDSLGCLAISPPGSSG
jgi:hypothetical protein